MAAVASDQATSICSHCDRAIPSSNLDLHFAHCSRNLEKCKTCGDMVPKKHAEEHFLTTHAPEVCGNRTELCHLCSRYIRLCERNAHESRCNGIADNVAESSRNTRAVEREPDIPRRHPNEFSKRRLLFTIAITGIAVLLGSLLFQRKAEHSQLH
nr:XIAP-associated factor 1-like [Ipomoea batatas]GMD91327.1 XIAP-associated factor 1-like [Ipomoea batatas]GME09303.1 XIAP-associated factor 1-like [Ipomoea batatas]